MITFKKLLVIGVLFTAGCSKEENTPNGSNSDHSKTEKDTSSSPTRDELRKIEDAANEARRNRPKIDGNF